MTLRIDPGREHLTNDLGTGILVRIEHKGRWVSADIAQLDRESLMTWLRSRGGANEWAENCVALLLNH